MAKNVELEIQPIIEDLIIFAIRASFKYMLF